MNRELITVNGYNIWNLLSGFTVKYFILEISDIDMKTAVAAYMHPVGGLWGFRTKEELQKNGVKTLIERPQELLKLMVGY